MILAEWMIVTEAGFGIKNSPTPQIITPQGLSVKPVAAKIYSELGSVCKTIIGACLLLMLAMLLMSNASAADPEG